MSDLKAEMQSDLSLTFKPQKPKNYKQICTDDNKKNFFQLMKIKPTYSWFWLNKYNSDTPPIKSKWAFEENIYIYRPPIYTY